MKKISLLLVVVCFLSVHNFAFAQEVVSTGGESLTFESPKSVVKVSDDFQVDLEPTTKHSSGGRKVNKPTLTLDKGVTSSPGNTVEAVPLETKQIHLRVETANGTLYNENIQVSPCPTSPTNAVEVVSAFCAISQSGLNPEWNWWGESAFLESLGGIANDNDAGIYWFWFSNLNFAEDVLNTHVLSDGEEILVSFGVFPMKLSLSTANPHVGETLAISLYEFGFDESWNPAWVLSTNSTLLINGETFANPTGTYNVSINSDSHLSFSGSKQGFITTDSMQVNPVFSVSRNNHRSADRAHVVVADQPVVQSQNSKLVVFESKNNSVAPQAEPRVVSSPKINAQPQLASSFAGWPKNIPIPLVFLGLLATGVVVYAFRNRFGLRLKS